MPRPCSPGGDGRTIPFRKIVAHSVQRLIPLEDVVEEKPRARDVGHRHPDAGQRGFELNLPRLRGMRSQEIAGQHITQQAMARGRR
jgi:hypothetical protein